MMLVMAKCFWRKCSANEIGKVCNKKIEKEKGKTILNKQYQFKTRQINSNKAKSSPSKNCLHTQKGYSQIIVAF